MSELPRIYRNYDLLFTPRLIPQLRNLRGEAWTRLIDHLSSLPHTHPDALGFSMMMVELGGCLTCEMDNFRAQRGCATCAQHTIVSFKGSEAELLTHYAHACQLVDELLTDNELQQAA